MDAVNAANVVHAHKRPSSEKRTTATENREEDNAHRLRAVDKAAAEEVTTITGTGTVLMESAAEEIGAEVVVEDAAEPLLKKVEPRCKVQALVAAAAEARGTMRTPGNGSIGMAKGRSLMTP